VSAPLDAARPIRAGDEIDLAGLQAFLTTALPGLQGPWSVEQFPKGHSNLTYLVRAADRELVLRRPPPGAKAIQSGHDMSREYRVLSRLNAVYPPAPRALVFCEEARSPLGAAFYVMERVPGVILRGSPPEGVDLSPATMQRVSEAFVDNLVRLHAVDVSGAGLSDLGHAEGYLKRQVDGWSQRYARAQTDENADMDSAARWLGGHIPAEATDATLIHNDYKYDNLVLDPEDLSRIRAVLDWEMATLGDPLADLGTSLAYWVDPDDPPEVQALGLGLTALAGNLGRRELAERYALKSGRSIDGLLFRYVLALFKVGVIAQQIFFRFKQGFTHDERFAALQRAVQILARQATRAIELGRIDRLSNG
jgi:aminoglycoside phosphotransferase (APT) family kinase protein